MTGFIDHRGFQPRHLRRRKTRRIVLSVLGLTLATVPFCASAGASPGAGPTSVVVTGLNNPRELAIGPDGSLFVAEAGDGGTYRVSDPEEGTEYVGPSGSISKVTDPATASDTAPVRVLTGLLSAAKKNGQQATGSDGVAMRGDGDVLVQETYFGQLPAFYGDQSGYLFDFEQRSGTPTEEADISGYEAAHDPDGQGVSSDPYALLRLPGRTLVADAAGNDILSVNDGGQVAVFHVFANVLTGPCAKISDPTPAFPGCNFVPDALATDRSGHIFVAGLSSLVPGQGQVVELNATGTSVLATYSGLDAPDGLAIGADGSIYVSQLLGKQKGDPLPGLVTRIAGAARTNTYVPVPAGLVLDNAGNLYVSAYSVAPASGLGMPGQDSSGQVWRLSTADQT